MRTMFYEFPEDAACWDISDAYMFGSDILVAPIVRAKSNEPYRLSAGRCVLDAGKKPVMFMRAEKPTKSRRRSKHCRSSCATENRDIWWGEI